MKYNKYFAYIISLIIILGSLFSYKIFLTYYTNQNIEKLRSDALTRYEIFNENLQNSLNDFEKNLVAVKNNSKFEKYLETNHKRYYLIDEMKNIATSKDYVEELFLSIALNSNNIFQLRYLDLFGKKT